ncbi:MAG: glycosyltransferase family 4 protein [Methylomonas sp.]|jgi:glycosyltransferase involved in cell wall biosynthesis
MSNFPKKVLFFANTEWYLFNFRLAYAKYLRAQGVEVVMLSPIGPYGPKLEEAGFRWIPLNMNRQSLHPWTELMLIWRILSIYRTEKPDIAHHFTIKCVVYGGLAARFAGISGVVSAVTGLGHVFIGQELKAKILRPFVRWMLGLVMNGKQHRLILQNPDDRSAFIAAGIASEGQTRLIAGSGVDTARFQPNPERPPHDCPTVVFAARLLWSKGLAELIEAIHQINAKGVTARFLIAGTPDPGNPASIPDETLDEWRNISNVELLGHVDDMVELLSAADIMVLPSYREGLPRSLIEAAAAGLPIVTTDTPGCRQAVADGVTGYLIPVRDSHTLATALRQLIEDPALAARMGAAGRQKALAEFDERIVFDKTFAVYQELSAEI